jgi:hypothetical protein
MDEYEGLRKKIAALEERAGALERRYEKLVGKADEFTPRINAIMRGGIPLEIFSRQSLIEADFDVFGIYPFDYINKERGITERSVDIYATKDSTYTVPEGSGKRSGESWPERSHLLVEIKQRRKGVEWIFCTLPTSKKEFSIAGSEIPIANAAFEIRSKESGSNTDGNPNDIANAVSQLNQAYLPFQLGILMKDSLNLPGMMRQYALPNGRNNIWLLLITNATLKFFMPPGAFHEIGSSPEHDSTLFKEVPWVVFQPEQSLSLQHHQAECFQRAATSGKIDDSNQSDFKIMAGMTKLTHEVHIIRYDYLDRFLGLVNDPPRIKKIQFNLLVDGKHRTTFEIGEG